MAINRRIGIHGAASLAISEMAPDPTEVGGGSTSWWNPIGDIVCPNMWAYRAINTPGSPWPGGPAVYANTLVNLANPGVNDLVEVPPAPPPVPWNVLIGWQFVTANAQCFDTGVVPANNQAWSMFVQFSNAVADPVTNRAIAGGGNPGVWFLLQPARLIVIPASYYYTGAAAFAAPILVTGNTAIVGVNGYRNGVFDAGPSPPAVGVFQSIYIGGRNNAGVPSSHITADIEAVAIYDCTLTAPQALAVAMAMAAL